MSIIPHNVPKYFFTMLWIDLAVFQEDEQGTIFYVGGEILSPMAGILSIEQCTEVLWVLLGDGIGIIFVRMERQWTYLVFLTQLTGCSFPLHKNSKLFGLLKSHCSFMKFNHHSAIACVEEVLR